jgi:streptogramin lyase
MGDIDMGGSAGAWRGLGSTLIGAALASAVLAAPAGAASLEEPTRYNTIAPGAVIGFAGSLSEHTGTWTVKQGATNVSSKFKLLKWATNGLFLWAKEAPEGEYSITAKDEGGESSPVTFKLQKPSDPAQTLTPIVNGTSSPTEPLGIAEDESGNIWFSDSGTNSIGELTKAGAILEYPLLTAKSDPTGVAIDQAGNVWVADNGAAAVTKLEPGAATPTTTKGETNYGLASGAGPDQVSVDPYGNVWVGEGGNGVLGEITTGGGVREWQIGGDLEGMVVDPFGNIWAVDESSGIDEIVPAKLPAPNPTVTAESGVYHAVAGSGGDEQIAVAPNGDVWFTAWSPPTLGVIVPSTSNPSEDHSYAAAAYPEGGEAPSGIGVDAAGKVFIEDAHSQSIYEFTPGAISGTEISGSWQPFLLGTWATNYSEGDEGNNLAVTPAGNVLFSGYVANSSTSGTPDAEAEFVQGFLGELPGVATAATSTGKSITGGRTTETVVSGSAGDEVVIPAGTEVKTSAGTPFEGTIAPPAADSSFVPEGPAQFAGLLGGSAFTLSPELSDGVQTHVEFSQCVTVVFSFPLPAGVTAAEAEAAKLYYYNFAALAWEEAGNECGDAGGKLGVTGGTVTVTLATKHLSSFAAFRQKPVNAVNSAPPPPPPTPTIEQLKAVAERNGSIKVTFKTTGAGAASIAGTTRIKYTVTITRHHRRRKAQRTRSLGYGSAKAASAAPTTVTITIPPSRKAGAELKALHKLLVSIVVTFTPTTGAKSTKTTSVTVRYFKPTKHKKHKKHKR